MIIVTGEFELAPQDRDTAIKAAIEMMAATAQEDGCLHYRFYTDIEHVNRFHVYEEWRDRDALEAHFKVPHMAKWRQVLGGLTVSSRKFKTIEAGEVTPL